MGIPISGPSYFYGNNMSVIHKTFRPESVFRKKSNSVCYYAFCEFVSMSKSLVVHIPRSENIADLMTKVIYGQRRKYLDRYIFFTILVTISHQ